MFAAAAAAARQVGLGINAGHDLSCDNLTDFLQGVAGVQEVSIGHALISDALELGYAGAVQAYLRCIDAAYADAHAPEMKEMKPLRRVARPARV